VLIDPKKRVKYDGSWGSRGSIPFSRAARQSESSSRTAEENPFSSHFFNSGVFNDNFFASIFGGRIPKLKASPIDYRLACTLEEMYSGTVKSIRLTRDVLVAG
jgi:DnaJ-class molecular chaperone